MKTLVSLSILVVLTACSTGTNQMNETIFTGGTVVVGVSQTPQRNYAVAVRQGHIVDVGPDADIRSHHAGARVVDVSSATILPGLTDAHAHPYSLGLALDTVSLVGANTPEEVVQRAQQRAAAAPAGEWILGRGWD